MGKDHEYIETFGDAVACACELESSFRQAHAVATLDDRGVVLDFVVFSRPNHTVDDALGWARCVLLNEPDAARIVLLSVVRQDVRRVRERDIAKFRKAREIFAGHGVDVLDWIQVGQGWLRSLAFTAGLGTWTSDGEPVVRARPPEIP